MENNEKPQEVSVESLRKMPTKCVSGGFMAPRDMKDSDLLGTLDLHTDFIKAVLDLFEDVLTGTEPPNKKALAGYWPVMDECRDRLKWVEAFASELHDRLKAKSAEV